MKKNKRLTDIKREAIVAAAIEEFKDNGFAGTSMDNVASRAKVSKRTVYNHFPSKDILFEQITDTIWEQSIKVTALEFDPQRDIREQLICIAQQEIDLLAKTSFQSLTRIYITECINSPDLAQKAMQRFSESETGIGQWLQEAINADQLKPMDTNFAKEQFLALIKAFSFWPQVIAGMPMPSESELQCIIESAVDMFLAYYAVQRS